MNKISTSFKFLLISGLILVGLGLGKANAVSQLPSERVTTIGREILVEKSRMTKIKAELGRLENDLGDNNLSYLNNLKQIENAEKEIAGVTERLEKNGKALNEIEVKINELLKGLLTRFMDEDQDSQKILERKVLQSMMKEELQRLAEGRKDNTDLSQKLVSIKGNLEKLRGLEIQISKILLNLEEKKKTYVGLFHHGMKIRSQTESELKIAAKEDTGQSKKLFSFPLALYDKIQFKDKGITFKFKGVQPVQSVKKGTVIYSGPLSTFGNVVVLDHGDTTRTVILGQFRVKIRKNEVVNQGDILGYTFANDTGGGNLYFEVRKNNTVQNAISWIDQSQLRNAKGAKRPVPITTNL